MARPQNRKRLPAGGAARRSAPSRRAQARAPRPRARKAAVDSEAALFRLVLEHITSGILVLDAAGTVRMANPAARAMLGLAEGALGRPLEQCAPRTAAAFLGPMPGPRQQVSVSRPDGSQLHLGYHLVPVALLDGAGRIVIFRDIGPLLAADARRRRAERLAQVGETAAKLVHDLKNPLAGILTGLRILERDTSVPQAQRPLLARTAAQVHELSSLASQFLDQARPARPAPRLLPARQEIRQALEPLELAASGFGVRLELLLSEEPILLALDPSDFRRALGNLVHNAIEASPRGGTVTVELAPLGPREIATRLRGFPGLVAAVRVRDQGTGLAPGQLARIFEPFYSTKPAGTGLGLPIAREIIEAHGGTLDVLPAGGTGTTFEILLPSGTRPRCSESVRCGDCGDCPVNRSQANFCCWAAQSDGSCQRGRPDRCLECSYYLRYNLNGYLQSTGAQTP